MNMHEIAYKDTQNLAAGKDRPSVPVPSHC